VRRSKEELLVSLTRLIDAADTDGSTANNDSLIIADAFGSASAIDIASGHRAGACPRGDHD
jgi:hypothetical protein